MSEVFSLRETMALLLLGVGIAAVAGNAAALWRGRGGRRPSGVAGTLHRGRAWFILVVGIVLVIWALATLATSG